MTKAKGFNAQAFLQQTVEGAMDTQRAAHPIGDWDNFRIADVDINSGTVEKGERAGKPWAQLKLKCENTDPNVAEEMKLASGQVPTVYHTIFLDLDDNNQLDMSPNRNVQLGKVRHAVGQNTDEEWSLMDLKGAAIGLSITHGLNKDGDPYAEVASVYNPDEDGIEDDEE